MAHAAPLAPPAPSPSPLFPLLPAELAILASTTVSEKLLVAQAVHELGTPQFAGVAKLLAGHKQLKGRAKGYFNAERTQTLYGALMKEIGMDPTITYAANSPELLVLARRHYLLRVIELRALMEEEQAKFKVVYAEIEGIKNGEWDYKLTGGSPPVLGEKVGGGDLGEDAVQIGDAKQEEEGGDTQGTEKDIGTKDVGDALDDDALVADGGAVVDERGDVEMEG